MEKLKLEKITQLKLNINQLFSVTDWVVVRKFERGIDIPGSIADERAKILADCDRIEAEINALQTIEEVKNYQIVL